MYPQYPQSGRCEKFSNDGDEQFRGQDKRSHRGEIRNKMLRTSCEAAIQQARAQARVKTRSKLHPIDCRSAIPLQSRHSSLMYAVRVSIFFVVSARRFCHKFRQDVFSSQHTIVLLVSTGSSSPAGLVYAFFREYREVARCHLSTIIRFRQRHKRILVGTGFKTRPSPQKQSNASLIVHHQTCKNCFPRQTWRR